jgi:hypothetical protein
VSSTVAGRVWKQTLPKYRTCKFRTPSPKHRPRCSASRQLHQIYTSVSVGAQNDGHDVYLAAIGSRRQSSIIRVHISGRPLQKGQNHHKYGLFRTPMMLDCLLLPMAARYTSWPSFCAPTETERCRFGEVVWKPIITDHLRGVRFGGMQVLSGGCFGRVCFQTLPETVEDTSENINIF